MKPRLLPSLALASLTLTGAIALSACAGEPDTSPTPRPAATPVDTSLLPPPSVQPSPDARTTPPSGSVTADNLPEAASLEWNEASTWRALETRAGGGTEQLSVCQQTRLESLGANAIQVRTYSLSGDGGDGVAIAMSFDDRALADQAYGTVQDWVADCRQVLQAQERTDGSQGIAPTPVDVPGEGRAQVTEWAYRSPSTEPGNLEFESQGLVQTGDRLGLLIMRIEGQDNNWDVEAGGPTGAIHPMIRNIPAVADSLRG